MSGKATEIEVCSITGEFGTLLIDGVEFPFPVRVNGEFYADNFYAGRSACVEVGFAALIPTPVTLKRSYGGGQVGA